MRTIEISTASFHALRKNKEPALKLGSSTAINTRWTNLQHRCGCTPHQAARPTQGFIPRSNPTNESTKLEVTSSAPSENRGKTPKLKSRSLTARRLVDPAPLTNAISGPAICSPIARLVSEAPSLSTRPARDLRTFPATRSLLAHPSQDTILAVHPTGRLGKPMSG
jgi:hypothetical protein